MRQKPLVVCSYGWGRVFRLYYDSLEVDGTMYALADLVQVRPVYHQVMGIPSARLELRFKKHDVTLRGIAAINDIQKVAAYLNCLCPRTNSARTQRDTNERPARADNPRASRRTPVSERYTSGQFQEAEQAQEKGHWPHWRRHEQEAVMARKSPVSEYDINRKAYAQALTAPMPAPHWQRLHIEQRERWQRRQRTERSVREHGFDVERLAQRLQERELPRVPIPIHLAPGEFAHYSTEAKLREAPYITAAFDVYPAKDCGTLILTNKRLIYFGRKCQMVLDYPRLSQYIRLRGAIAIMAGHWSCQEVLEIRRPLECTMYLDCIIQRFQRQQLYEEDQQIKRIAAHLDYVTQRRKMQTPSIVDIDTIPLATTGAATVIFDAHQRQAPVSLLP